MSLTFAVNVLAVDDRVALWSDNQLATTQRHVFFATMLLAGTLPWWLGTMLVWRKDRDRAAESLFRWGWSASPLALLGPVLPLVDRDAFLGSPVAALGYLLIIGLMASVIGHGWLEHGYRWVRQPRSTAVGTASRLPVALVGTTCALLFAHLAYYSVLRHLQMRTQAYDLAIFDNMMWQLLHGNGFVSTPAFGPEGNHLHRHVTLGAPLLLPFYALAPRAETLLVLQALFSAMTPIPIYLLAKKLLENAWLGAILAIGYALYAPTHGGNFYDFHFLTMAAPLFAWVFYLLFTENTRMLAAMTILTLLWREDTGAILVFGGLFVLALGVRPKRTLWFIAGCLAYFVIVKFILMPLGDSHASFSDYYRGLKAPGTRGFAGVLETLVTNPWFAFSELFDRRRLLYLMHLLVPVLLFPLRTKTGWIALVPAALFTLLATHSPVYEIYFQYVAYWAPSIFLVTIAVLRNRFVEPGLTSRLRANVVAIALTILLSSYLFSSVFLSPTMRGGFGKFYYEWTEEDSERLDAFRRIAAQIPEEASVTLTEHEAPHMSNRARVYAFREGIFDAEYLVLRKGAHRGKSNQASHVRAALASGEYELVATDQPFILFRREVEGVEDQR